MNSPITHLTNDHLRNFIVHLRIVNFFFCLVYYLPDPTLHWAPTAFETNTPFWCTSLFFFLWRHQNDVMMTSPVPNVNLTSSVLPLAKIDNGVFLLVRIKSFFLIGSQLLYTISYACKLKTWNSSSFTVTTVVSTVTDLFKSRKRLLIF